MMKLPTEECELSEVSLRALKGRAFIWIGCRQRVEVRSPLDRLLDERTAGPSTALRSGRDDNSFAR